MREIRVPQLFVAAGSRRGLLGAAALTLASGAAMLVAVLALDGASVLGFEFAGSVDRAEEILDEWGASGEKAMWWQLALDVPFLVGYGLFLAGACMAVASRARRAERPRLERAAAIVAWFGPLAAAADLVQNASLGVVLSGDVTQPWPRISAVAGAVTFTLAFVALFFAAGGWLATRERGTELS
jgi:hypothetical protein